MVEDIWTSSPDEDHFFALCSTSKEVTVLKVQIPSVKVIEKVKVNPHLTIPECPLQMKQVFEVNENGPLLKTIYFLAKKNNSLYLTSQDNLSGKEYLLRGVFY